MGTFGKIIVAIVVIVALALCWRFVAYRSTIQPGEVADEQVSMLQYSNAERKIAFSYPSSYEIGDKELGTGADIHTQITLTAKTGKKQPKNGEGPTTITVEILTATSTPSLEPWLTTVNASNFTFTPDNAIATTTVGGLDATMYRVDGLYAGYANVVRKDAYLYVFTATYITGNDAILDVYSSLLNSVNFK